MGCDLDFRRNAEKFLKRASETMLNRINERLEQLANNPICEEKLKPPLQSFCKTRVGSYRIVYLLRPCSIIIVAIGERESIYYELRQVYDLFLILRGEHVISLI